MLSRLREHRKCKGPVAKKKGFIFLSNKKAAGGGGSGKRFVFAEDGRGCATKGLAERETV